MAEDSKTGFFLTNVEASCLMLFVGDVLEKFDSTNACADWLSSESNCEDDMTRFVALIVTYLMGGDFGKYVRSLDPKEMAKATLNEGIRILKEVTGKCLDLSTSPEDPASQQS